MWAAACILAEMLVKPYRTLFTAGPYRDNLIELINEYFQLFGTPTSPDDIEWLPGEYAIFIRALCSKQAVPPGWSNLSISDVAALDLLQKLLKFNPLERITAGKALEHEYFNNTLPPDFQATPLCSTSLSTSTVKLEQLTTTTELIEFLCDEVKQMRQND